MATETTSMKAVIVGCGSVLCGFILVVGAFIVAQQRSNELTGRRLESMNNVKQIGFALLVYHDAEGRFPEAHKNGLSWRVWLLRYIEEDELFRQFHLDQAWDSPHNKQLLGRMPKIYRPRRYTLASDETTYRAVVGPNTVFGTKGGVMLDDIATKNGTARTLLVVEAGDPVPWTKPDELDFTPGRPLPPLGGPRRGSFVALFANAHVQMLPQSTPEQTLRHMVDWTNTEAFEMPK